MTASDNSSVIDYKALSLTDRLSAFRRAVDGPIVFTTSLGIEDQAITHAIASANLAIDIVTLDTGRLFKESYELWAQTEKKYNIRIKVMFPRPEAVESYVASNGINAFYESLELRKACCYMRKVEPLGRALNGAAGWISGIRADQTENRADVKWTETDSKFNVLKFSPILDWTAQSVRDYVAKNDIPYNTLHDQGFPSIGCQPCTRAVTAGEDERAGRWWWEQDEGQECGLHIGPDGRLTRMKA